MFQYIRGTVYIPPLHSNVFNEIEQCDAVLNNIDTECNNFTCHFNRIL